MSWLPENWLDESVPELADDPSDFIEKREDGSFWLALLPDDPVRCDEEDLSYYASPLREGRVVKFCEYRDYGDFQMAVAGEAFIFDQPIPMDADCFVCEFDPETVFDSPEALVQDGPLAGETESYFCSVHVYHWTKGVPFRFKMVDGVGRFVRLDGQA